MKTNSLKSQIVEHFKSRLAVGISVLLPIIIMVSIIGWVLNKIDNLVVKPLMPIAFLPDVIFDIPGIGAVIIIIMAYIVGQLSFNRIGKFGIKLLNRIHGYEEIKKAISMLLGLGKSDTEPKRIVLVEYPSEGILALGLAMSESTIDDEPNILIFIANPPIPNNGNLAFFPKTRVRYAITSTKEGEENYYMTRNQYIKYIISAGTVSPSNIQTTPAV